VNCPAHWALSPLDLQAHLLLAEGCHPKGVLKARCGHLLPLGVMRFAEVSARKCTDCHLMSLSDAILALRRENPDAADGQAGHGAPGQEGRLAMTTIWYQRSGRDHDTHRGTLCRGRVQAACGAMFTAYGTALPGDPPDPHRICLRCGLSLDEHSEWLALLRVRAGAISMLGEVYVYQGRLFPAVSLIAAALHRLAAAGMLTLTEPDRSVVSLTEAGQARYKTLDQRQRASADLP
jgi:hypothetical protein